MLKDIALMGAGAIFGLGATIMALAAPLYFPNAPPSVWHWLFWSGVTLMFLMIVDATILLVVPFRILHLGPAILLNFAVFVFVMAVVWQLDTPDNPSGPDISFQKYAVFWITVDQDIYEMGIVSKLFNLDNKPYLVKDITFDINNWTLFPGCGATIQRYIQYDDKPQSIEDNYIKPNSEAYLKKKLPIGVYMSVVGDMPEFILRDGLGVVIDGNKKILTSQLFSTYRRPISPLEWDNIEKPQSKIDVEEFHYKQIPSRPKKDAIYIYYAIFFGQERNY